MGHVTESTQVFPDGQYSLPIRTGLAGDGIVPAPAHHGRSHLKEGLIRTLRAAGLLDTARRLRRTFRNYEDFYQLEGGLHNLFVIFRKISRHKSSD